jgi:NAD(P)-dependent dehydrogenase (short-subunit alcohol dehydrogenase family)
MKLQGSVALVTGGASGLGAATARRLIAGGARVVIVDRDDAKGPALAGELGASASYAKADVTDAAQVEAAVASAAALGALRIAVSCAGVGWASRTLDKTGKPHDLELFRTVVGINLIGTFNVLRLAAAAIAKSDPVDGERGVIVNTASVAAFDGQIGQIAYAASKAGVAGMTLPAARDLAPAGIRVVTIAPGIFDTPMLGALRGSAIRRSTARWSPRSSRPVTSTARRSGSTARCACHRSRPASEICGAGRSCRAVACGTTAARSRITEVVCAGYRLSLARR